MLRKMSRAVLQGRLLCVLIVVGWSQLARGAESEDAKVASAQKQCRKLRDEKKYDAALIDCRRWVDAATAALGPDATQTMDAVHELAVIHAELHQYEPAAELLKRVVAMDEKTLGPNHLTLAHSLTTLGDITSRLGQCDAAQALFSRALSIREKAPEVDPQLVTSSLDNLARVAKDCGQYAQAESLYRRALALREKRLGPEHAEVALTLQRLAALLWNLGQYAQSEALLLRALFINEKQFGPSHIRVARVLNVLALGYQNRNRHAEAEKLFSRALSIQEKQNPRSEDVAVLLNNLAELWQQREEYARARPYFERALAIFEENRRPSDTRIAMLQQNLAWLACEEGQYAQAEKLFQRAQDSWEKSLGMEHPDTAKLYYNMAHVALAQKQYERGLAYLKRMEEIHERVLSSTVSEPRVQAMLAEWRQHEDRLYGLLLERKNDPQLQKMALTLSLLRKGRAAESGAQASQSIQSSLRTPAQRQRFADWQRLRAEQETLLFGSSAQLTASSRRDKMKALQLQIEDLEHELVATSPSLRTQQVPSWDRVIAQVASKLPQQSALLEIVDATPFRFTAKKRADRWLPRHYIALLLFPDARIESLDLGEADSIDTAIEELLKIFSNRESEPVAAAQAFYQKVLAGAWQKLSGVSRIYLSLDGALNLIPFAALHDGKQYFVDRYEFHYLTSGRDLLRDPVGPPGDSPLIVADPDYAAAPAEAEKGASRAMSGNVQRLYRSLHHVPRLPATRKEATQLSRLLPGAHVYLDRTATEAILQTARAPRIVHLATHGLFLPDAPPDARFFDSASRGFVLPGQVEAAASQELDTRQISDGEEINPLSRSALVLAGAAHAGESSDASRDGLLTAEEVRSLNLWGTQLVVLSACDTGRGVVRTGQGVYGLRRAFFIAGAATVVTSLWQVADSETGKLMTRYYTKLAKDRKPRVGALREAMQDLKSERPHPYYWAPFIVIGQDGPLLLPPR